MRDRLSVVCHLWPGLTPMNVWDMTYEDWVLLAAAADAWVEAQRQERTTTRGSNGPRPRRTHRAARG